MTTDKNTDGIDNVIDKSDLIDTYNWTQQRIIHLKHLEKFIKIKSHNRIWRKFQFLQNVVMI